MRLFQASDYSYPRWIEFPMVYKGYIPFTSGGALKAKRRLADVDKVQQPSDDQRCHGTELFSEKKSERASE